MPDQISIFFLLFKLALKLLFSHKFVSNLDKMESSEKNLAELGRVLKSGNRNEIDRKIKSLRSEAPFAGALRMLALYFDSTDDEVLRQTIMRFFNDMKERSARNEVIESLVAVTRQSSKTMLASSCWQSGLDYSEYAVNLAEAFMDGDYETSLECFTVIENCSDSIGEDDIEEIILRLEKEITRFDAAKKRLTQELILVLKG
jgi:hypothetical protein